MYVQIKFNLSYKKSHKIWITFVKAVFLTLVSNYSSISFKLSNNLFSLVLNYQITIFVRMVFISINIVSLQKQQVENKFMEFSFNSDSFNNTCIRMFKI